MAKKPEINQSAEIRSILGQLGKDAMFKDVFEKLQAQYRGHKFNKNSCQQAFTDARKKLGFSKGPRRGKPAARPKAALAARVVPAGTPIAKTIRGDEGLVGDAITTAQKLIAACGGGGWRRSMRRPFARTR